MKIIHDEREGYRVISNNNIQYDLLEGVSLAGKSTSDIVFIIAQLDREHLEGVDDFVDYVYGASTIGESDTYDNDIWNCIRFDIEDYEYEHPEVVEHYKGVQE